MNQSPVFLLGTHRSGTTWLGSILGQAPGFAYWVEPRQVWSYKNWHKPDDVLTASDATDQIKRHIRHRFERFVGRHQAVRFCEKTPSNCLRIPFMFEVFPNGKYILLVRDGRAVYRSTDEIQSKGADWNRIWVRIRESSIKELPAYFDRIPWIWKKLIGQRLEFWGVRPPGWQDWIGQYSAAEIIALQWANSISIAVDDLGQLSDDRKLIIRYEELIADPATQIGRLCDFAAIAEKDVLISAVESSIRPGSQGKWRDELSEELLSEIKPILLPALTKLGYDW